LKAECDARFATAVLGVAAAAAPTLVVDAGEHDDQVGRSNVSVGDVGGRGSEASPSR
jgi:hypothetical protein